MGRADLRYERAGVEPSRIEARGSDAATARRTRDVRAIAVTLLGLAAVPGSTGTSLLAAAAPHRGRGPGLQHVRVEVKGGYTPSVVRVRAGVPVRLEFPPRRDQHL